MATGRHNDKGRWVANAVRHESVHLCRRLRALGLQHQQELARVRGAQLDLQRALARLSRPGPPARPAPVQPPAVSAGLVPLQNGRRPPAQPYCPNHIVCSSCNLRLRLADSLTRRFTPSLWTMYCRPQPPTYPDHGQAVLYSMPPFVQRRNLSTSDNSLRYLPFV